MTDSTMCVWADDGDASTWHSSCGHYWVFEDGGPTANGCKFCPFCGKPLNEIPARFDEWGDPIADDDEDDAV